MWAICNKHPEELESMWVSKHVVFLGVKSTAPTARRCQYSLSAASQVKHTTTQKWKKLISQSFNQSINHWLQSIFLKVEKLIDSICCWSSFPHSHLDPEVGRNLQPLIWSRLWSLVWQILSETQNDTIKTQPSHFKTANMFPKMMQCLGAAARHHSSGACSLQRVLLLLQLPGLISWTCMFESLKGPVWGIYCDFRDSNEILNSLHLLLGCFRIISNNINYLYFMRLLEFFNQSNNFRFSHNVNFL